MRSRKFSWLRVRLQKLVEMTSQGGWRWCANPRTKSLCLLSPHGKMFDFRAQPVIEIREHKVVNEQLL